jgi:acyl carrier protein
VAAELGVAGASLARGYLGDPARTAERFVPDPLATSPGERLYRTGDLVRHLPDGRLEFLGRGDGQVKIRGIRVELGEVEAALAAHPGVAAAAVAVRGEGAAARLAAYVVPRAGGLDAGALRRWMKERLPAAMVPAACVELPALPLTANGKVDRAALPEPAAVALADGEFVPPQNAMEEILAGIWSELLEVPRVGAHDSFFDLGGHSLQAVRLMSRIRELLGVELPVRAVFEAPTLAELAAAVAAEMERGLEEGSAAPAPDLSASSREGSLDDSLDR